MLCLNNRAGPYQVPHTDRFLLTAVEFVLDNVKKTSQYEEKMLNSDYTRQRIINAAYDLFGRVGYTATTVRMIAEQADVSLSAIPYYYESKENLFRIVADLSINEFSSFFEEINKEIDGVLQNDCIDSFVAKNLFEKLVNRHLDYVFNTENEVQLRFLFQLRSSQDHPDYDNDRFYSITIKPMCSLIRILRPDIEDINEIIVIAYAIIGEHLVFCYHRPSILSQLGTQDYNEISGKIKSILVERDLKSIIH